MMNCISLKTLIFMSFIQCILLKFGISSTIKYHLDERKSATNVKEFQNELQNLKKLPNHIRRRNKRSIASNYEDIHCLKNFETKDNAIIKTKESQANGAQYLNETKVETFDFCLRYCCETTLCNVAVYDVQVY